MVGAVEVGFVAGEAHEGVGFVVVGFELGGEGLRGSKVLGKRALLKRGRRFAAKAIFIILGILTLLIGLANLIPSGFVVAIEEFGFGGGDSAHSPEGLGDAFGEDVFHGGFGVEVVSDFVAEEEVGVFVFGGEEGGGLGGGEAVF